MVQVQVLQAVRTTEERSHRCKRHDVLRRGLRDEHEEGACAAQDTEAGHDPTCLDIGRSLERGGFVSWRGSSPLLAMVKLSRAAPYRVALIAEKIAEIATIVKPTWPSEASAAWARAKSAVLTISSGESEPTTTIEIAM